MLQDSDDSELKGACGFTPHPDLKVCEILRFMSMFDSNCGCRVDDLNGAFGHEMMVEQAST